MYYAGDVPLRIVNLKPSTTYLLRVRAVNDVGAGTPVVRTQLTENIRMCGDVHAFCPHDEMLAQGASDFYVVQLMPLPLRHLFQKPSLPRFS